jgi:signal transduction histidine kinase/CheY-like chemotaxis protein
MKSRPLGNVPLEPSRAAGILHRFRSINIFMYRNSIAIPIILILLFIAAGILFAGYYINEHVFYNVFEERESSKARNIHLTIESLISSEEKRITSFAKVLRRDTDITYGLYHHRMTGGDLKPLKSVMNQLYSQMNLHIFLMADPKGNVLYRADQLAREEKLGKLPSFDKALKGEPVITAAETVNGWDLRAFVPISAFETNRPSGVLILGSRINDDFAKRIAKETGNQVFIATPAGVLAKSHEKNDPPSINLSLVGKSLAGGQPIFHADRQNFRSFTYVPLRIIDKELCLVIETDISIVQDLLRKNKVEMAQWGLIIFLGVTLIGAALTITLIRPLNELQERARQVIREYSGDDAKAVPAGSEISTLVRAINVMVQTIRDHHAERLKAEEHLRQSQRMEAIGKLAGGVAHDFNNLLSVITGYSELLLGKLRKGSPGLREVEEIHKAGERAASLTHQLLAFGRRQVLKPKILRMDEAVSNVSKMLRRLIGEDIEMVTVAVPELWTVQADPTQIDQVLINLAVNARDAMPKGGTLSLSTSNVEFHFPLEAGDWTLPAGQYVALEVADTGCGMDPGTLSRIFEPFFTTKEQGKGTGLGLATVYGIVNQSGGYIRVLSEPGKGTTFIAYFPRARDTGPAAGRKEVGKKALSGDETILLVEDEEMVRELATETLRGYGYTVLEAGNGEEAIAASTKCRGTIHLLITDVVMPGMNGLEVAQRVKSARADILVLYMSGYSEEAVTHLGVMGPGEGFLQKPITPSRLSSRVREMLSGRENVTPV